MMVSAIMASYNGARYIGEQLQSILDQTRQVDEVIIRDDCSTDNTVEIVQQFLDDHQLTGRWFLYINESNLGYAENIRRAIQAAQGDVIFLSDQDDIWCRDRVEKMVGMMTEHPEIGLLNTKYVPFTSKTSAVMHPNSQYHQLRKIELNPYNRFLRYPGCVMCFRKSFYEQVAKYWFQGWAHDEFLWCLAVLMGRCYAWEYESLQRRIHDGQTSGHLGHSREKRIAYLKGEVACSEALLKIAKDNQIDRRRLKIYRNNLAANRDRLELIENRKFYYAIPLLRYLKYYFSAKSYLIELKLAWKGEKT